MRNYRFLISAVVFLILVMFVQPLIVGGLENVDEPNYWVGGLIIMSGMMGILGTNFKLMEVDAAMTNDESYRRKPSELNFGVMRMWHLIVILLFPAFGVMLAGGFSNPEVETISGIVMVVLVGVFLFWEMFTVSINGRGEIKRNHSALRQIQGDAMLMIFTVVLYSMLISTIFGGAKITNFADFFIFALLFSTLWFFLILPARLGYIVEEFVLHKGQKSENRIMIEQTVVFLLLGLLPPILRGVFS